MRGLFNIAGAHFSHLGNGDDSSLHSQVNYTNISQFCDPFLIPSVHPTPHSVHCPHDAIWATLHCPLTCMKGYLPWIPAHPTHCPNFGQLDNLLLSKMLMNVNISIYQPFQTPYSHLKGIKSLKPNSENSINFRLFSWLVRKILEGRN